MDLSKRELAKMVMKLQRQVASMGRRLDEQGDEIEELKSVKKVKTPAPKPPGLRTFPHSPGTRYLPGPNRPWESAPPNVHAAWQKTRANMHADNVAADKLTEQLRIALLGYLSALAEHRPAMDIQFSLDRMAGFVSKVRPNDGYTIGIMRKMIQEAIDESPPGGGDRLRGLLPKVGAGY
jgi:hypothetical protein